jgi:hypothetical protein
MLTGATCTPPSPETIIIDNRDPGATIEAGTWEVATNDGNGSWGADFLYHFADQADVGRVRYTPTITRAGSYAVSIFWSADPNRATDELVTVHHAAGVTQYRVNFQQYGNQWYTLGHHTFNAGNAGYLEFTSDATNGYCNADAVRWVSD